MVLYAGQMSSPFLLDVYVGITYIRFIFHNFWFLLLLLLSSSFLTQNLFRFSRRQQNVDMSTTEEARRLILRAANCPRSPRGLNGLTAASFQTRGGPVGVVAPLAPPLPPPPVTNHSNPSSSASSASSSGYSSLHDQLLRVAPPGSSSGTSSASISPTGASIEPIISTPQYANGLNGFLERPVVKVSALGTIL